MRILSSAALRALLSCCAFLISACGGDSSSSSSTGTSATQLVAQEVDAPTATGEMATDGLNWINYRRQQAGLAVPRRDARIDSAAAAHAAYQQLNNVVTHDEVDGRTGFSGTTSTDRLRAAGYPLGTALADGEVIAAIAESDGFAAAEGLLAAIYHRYLMLEPRFDQAGAASAHRAGGYYWLNVNFVATRAGSGLGSARVAVWPVPEQRNVRTAFLSDEETPDPVPGRNQVGYPLSVHADLGKTLRTGSFSVRESGADPLAVRLLDGTTDTDTPSSAAAIIPLSPLRSATRYDVAFNGTLDGAPLVLSWSFTTR